MIPVEEALQRILAGVEPTPSEWISVRHACGRVLAEPVVSRRTNPPFDVSAMDGYAVRAEDLARPPTELDVAGESAAGHAPEGLSVAKGLAIRIFTGARMPSGADAVVMQEDVEVLRPGRIRVGTACRAGAFIRRRGLDVEQGRTILEPGALLAPRHVAIAAGVDCPWVRVHRRPRVAILATGDELGRPGEPLSPEQIVASSTYGLQAHVEAWGGEAVDLGIAPDDRAGLLAAARGALGVDMLVTTGGASVGDHDLIRSVLGDDGLKLDFWKVAMRPGKPLIFGHLRGTPFLGLPGNPVSSLVCAWLFLRPALQRMRGRTDTRAPIRTARAGAPLPANDARQDYLRVRLGESELGLVATPFLEQDSSMLHLLARSDGLLIRPPHAPAAAEGDAVEVLVFEAQNM